MALTQSERSAQFRQRRDEELRELRAQASRSGDSFAKGVFNRAQSAALPGFVAKADQTVGTTGTAGWAAEATRTGWRDYLISLAPFNAGGRLIEQAAHATIGQDNVLNYPTIAALPAVPGWVGEGEPIPAGAVNFSTTALGPPRKLGNIMVWTKELAKRSNATAIFAQLLRESVAASIDSVLLATTAGSASAHAGLLNGVAALGAYPGSDLVAAENDLAALAAACAASGGSGRCTFITTPERVGRLRVLAPLLANSIDLAASASVPADRVIGIDAASLIVAVDQEPDIMSTECGLVHMNTAPGEIVTGAGVVADPVRESWQTAAIAIRILHWFAFARRRVAAVNFIDGASW